jgi:membrane protease YdiL (CAAX protease family)
MAFYVIELLIRSALKGQLTQMAVKESGSDTADWYRSLRPIVIAILLIVSAFVLANLIALLVIVALSTLGIAPHSVSGRIALIIEQEVVFGLTAVVYATYRYPDLISSKRPSIRTAGWIVGGVLLLLGVAQVLGFVFQQFGISSGANRITQIGRDNPQLLLYLIPVAIFVIGPGEELLFRGGVQSLLRRSFSAIPAVVIASVLFGLVHIPAVVASGIVGVTSYVATTIVLGLVLGSLYEYTDNILVPALVHGGYNAILFAGLYILTTT